MKHFQGQDYNDDRIFILDLQLAQKGSEEVWAVTTRRNTRRIPPFRVDDFSCKEEAVEFIEKIEPTTPRISLGGQSPEKPLSYEEYIASLRTEGLIPAMEMFEKGLGFPGKSVIMQVTEDELKALREE